MSQNRSGMVNTLGKAAILLAAIMGSYAFIGLTPILPQMQAHFSDVPGSATLVRSMITVMGLAIVVGSPLAGILADRFGIRPMLIVSSAGFGVGLVGLFVDNLYVLLASRVIVGFASAALGTLITTLITVAFHPDERNRWLGLQTTVGALSSLVLLPIAGLLGQISWRGPFAFFGVALFQVLFVIFGLPNTSEKQKAPVSTSPVSSVPESRRSGIPFVLILTGLLAGIVAGTSAMFLPFHLSTLGETDPARVSIALLPMLGLTGVLALLYGRIRAKVSVNGAFVIGFGLAACGLVWAGLSNSYMHVVLGQGLAGVGIGVLMPNLYAFAGSQGSAAQRGSNIGVTRGAFYAGPLVAQFALEPVIGMIGAGGALASLGFCAVLGFLGFVAAHGRRGRAEAV